MKVVFFGNHTVGVTALKALITESSVVGIVAHPNDPEDGLCYESVYDFACSQNIPVIRGQGKDVQVAEFISIYKPDLIWVTDYRYILPDKLLGMAVEGGVNLHPSLLPKYRGRAPLNWAIINGEKTIGLTAHFMTSDVDDGDIIEQRSFELNVDEDVGDALDKLMPLYESITRSVIRSFIHGNVQRKIQANSLATTFKARKPSDGKIDWEKSAERIRDLVRAVAKPYPGAYTILDGKRMYIWKAELLDSIELSVAKKPGTIVNVTDSTFIVVCGEGMLNVLNYTVELEKSLSLKNGTLLN